MKGKVDMNKHKYMIGFLFIFLLLIPFKVNGEQLTERVTIIFNNEIDYKLLEEKDLEVHHIFEEYDAVSVTIPVSMRDNLNARPNIRFIEEDPEVETTSQTASWGYRSLDIEDVKQTGLTGKGIKIGILDTGVRTDHPDLHISGGATFVQGTSSYNDDFGHGTHVAGIIASQDNDLGTVGVAPDAQLYAVKVLDNNGKGNQSDVVAGINWAMEQQLDIINLSITSPTGSFLLQETLQKAYDQGMLIIAASGNFVTPVYENINVLFPAQYSTVIAVGAVNENLVRSSFSYYGQDLDFVAPGENIYSTYNGLEDGEYQLSTGTSMAAPFVTGMAALYKEAYPTLNSTEILSRMERSSIGFR